MSTNLVSTITQLLSSNIISRIASSLGLEKAEAQTGVEAGVPALLAALTSLVSKPGGASALSGAIAQQQPGLLSDLSKVIGSSAQEDVMKSGMSAMSSLLGGSALSSLTSALGRYAGLGNNASQGLMGLLGPVVMGALDRLNAPAAWTRMAWQICSNRRRAISPVPFPRACRSIFPDRVFSMAWVMLLEAHRPHPRGPKNPATRRLRNTKMPRRNRAGFLALSRLWLFWRCSALPGTYALDRLAKRPPSTRRQRKPRRRSHP